ncbi:aminotransferase, partial [Candidatus Bathyarchaeota archaeon]
MKDMESVREQFPVTKNKVFLNHAAESPLPKPVADAVHKYVEEFSNFGESSIELEDRGKSLFAKLINAKPEELAIVENTSMGLNIAANLLRYPPGSKIVTTDMEYPSVVYPWLRKSLPVKVHYVKNVNGKILLEDVEKAVDDNTVAVVISHVEYFNGFRNDLG